MASQNPAGPLRNLLLRIAYDGTDFFGWQIQPERPTIQGVLAESLEAICGEKIEVCGSGRTDAGVHALNQAANAKLYTPIPCDNLVRALNRRLPESIRILSAQQVADDFHARHDAASKVYRYRVYRGEICLPALSRYVLPYPYPLDDAAMQQAASAFQGVHDFRSFAASDAEEEHKEKSCVRTVFSSVIEAHGEELIYTVEGNGFLHHMVRNIVGTLLDVGRGRIHHDAVQGIIAACNRSVAGPTAPARGLHLVSVSYPPERLRWKPSGESTGQEPPSR